MMRNYTKRLIVILLCLGELVASCNSKTNNTYDPSKNYTCYPVLQHNQQPSNHMPSTRSVVSSSQAYYSQYRSPDPSIFTAKPTYNSFNTFTPSSIGINYVSNQVYEGVKNSHESGLSRIKQNLEQKRALEKPEKDRLEEEKRLAAEVKEEEEAKKKEEAAKKEAARKADFEWRRRDVLMTEGSQEARAKNRKKKELQDKAERLLLDLAKEELGSTVDQLSININNYLQASQEGVFLSEKAKEQAIKLLAHAKKLQSRVKGSCEHLNSLILFDIEILILPRIQEELTSQEKELYKLKELTEQLLIATNLTIQELEQCGIIRDRDKGIIHEILPIISLLSEPSLPTVEALQQDVSQYLGKCQEDKIFQKLRDELALAITKVEVAPNSIVLQANKAAKEAALREHPFYHQGIKMGLIAAHHRYSLEQDAENLIIQTRRDETPPASIIREKRKQADRIKKELLNPLRAVFECPQTPTSGRKAQAFAKGIGKSAKDVIDLPGVLVKLGITAVESLVKWEDKLGLQSVQEAINTLLKETRYDWENPEEYRARCQTAKTYKAQMQAYDKAFNAAHYHQGQMETMGYVTAEAIQVAFGAEIFKGIEAGNKLVKGVDFAKITQKTSSALEWIKIVLKPNGKLIGVQKGTNPAVRTITATEAKDIIKQLMETGAKRVYNPRYLNGTWYELPGVGGFGVRTKSSKKSLRHGTPNTIDLDDLGLEGINKLKY